MYVAIAVNGFLLMMGVVGAIMVLGPAGPEIKYTMFYVVQLIDFQDVFTRIEALIGIGWIMGAYMKASIVLFILNFMISQLLNLKDDRILLFPIAIIAFLMAVTSYDHEQEFVEMVSTVWPLMITVFGVVPILFFTIYTMVRGDRGTGSSSQKNAES